MVGGWGCKQRMVLAQAAADAPSHAITAVPKPLEMPCSKGTILTTDPLDAQRAAAQQSIDQGGDALARKGDQRRLHGDACPFLDDPAGKTITAKPAIDAEHGHIETRTATV